MVVKPPVERLRRIVLPIVRLLILTEYAKSVRMHSVRLTIAAAARSALA